MNPAKVKSKAIPKFYSEKDIHTASCRTCNDRLASMRKTAVRWLYMEWYKRAVQGQDLPSVSEKARLNFFLCLLFMKEKHSCLRHEGSSKYIFLRKQ